MEFNKSRIYTVLNADELKLGSKVYVADNIDALKQYVEDDCDTSTITSIMPECYRGRFKVDGYDYTFALAYLVSKSEEKKLKWTDLKIGDVIRNETGTHTMMVTGIDSREEKGHKPNYHILISDTWLDDDDLTYWEKVEK